jgi:hypothetical protein
MTENHHHQTTEDYRHQTTQNYHHQMTEDYHHQITQNYHHQTTQNYHHQTMQNYHHQTTQNYHHQTTQNYPLLRAITHHLPLWMLIFHIYQVNSWRITNQKKNKKTICFLCQKHPACLLQNCQAD